MLGGIGIIVLLSLAAGADNGGAKASGSALAWPGEYNQLKVLNSLVTELLIAPVTEDRATLEFLNPREGWVFIALSRGQPDAEVSIDDRREPLVLRRNPDSGSPEAMIRLARGKHTLSLNGAKGRRLEARAVPELAYCYYLANPHIAPYGLYDKAFLDKYVLPHVNTLVTSGPPPKEDLEQWTREGRRFITNATLPGLSDKQAPAADAVFETWHATPGVDDPHYGGLIVDEFIGAGAEHYASWTTATVRLCEDPVFRGKTFYAFCGNLYDKTYRLEFARALIDRAGVFAIERYLTEEPTEEVADRWTRRQYQDTVRQWEEALPGVAKRIMFVLGYMSAPPENLDVNPAVDYNVLTEMQFHWLANDPACFGLYGLMEYSASYADEESLRWAHRLFRHYAIEGSRDRLSKDPYILNHLQNSDFADSLSGWSVTGQVTTNKMDGLSWIEGRYPRTKMGDTYASMKQSKDAPNSLRQTVKNLTPGRAYSLRFFTFNPSHLDENREAAAHVALDGARMDTERSFQYTFPSNYAHELGPYNREHPAYMTYYRIVFTPDGDSAVLTLSDTAGTTAQEMGVNFVQVQPYHLP